MCVDENRLTRSAVRSLLNVVPLRIQSNNFTPLTRAHVSDASVIKLSRLLRGKKEKKITDDSIIPSLYRFSRGFPPRSLLYPIFTAAPPTIG